MEKKCSIYIDPNPSSVLNSFDLEYVKKKAVEGVNEIVTKILNKEI